ncbi:prepilin-type N-terminal cleavage/methylation domain-containing protein [Candidatus Parcubacteria bacterium]|nr:prepilin-type N-terminal cleavage/methylation domain-containing protein [Candidatus Parcubacteria bacterium]
MKKTKSKGFTLIELMVVISIISLLSSVVLASIKTAKEKADNAKIVSEMKSLQTALELYRAKIGIYPQVNVDEDESTGQGGFNNFVKTSLVDNKLISKVIQSKGYPDNCYNNTDCYGTGNTFIYFTTFLNTGNPNRYYMCDGQKTQNYVLGYITPEKLNLPKFTYYNGSVLSTGFRGAPINTTTVYEYCLSM